MKQQKKIDEASEAPNVTTDQVLKTFKLFKPNSALTYLAQQADMKPAEYLAKNIFKILGYSLKNGAIKAADLIGGLKKINVKSGEDNTGIDYDSIDIDEDTIQFNVLFGDKDSKTAIIEFLNKYKESQDNIEEEIKEKAKEIQDDAKQKGITFSDKEIQENGVNIAIGVNKLKETPKKKIDPKKVKTEISDAKKHQDELEKLKKQFDSNIKKIFTQPNKDLDKLVKAQKKNTGNQKSDAEIKQLQKKAEEFKKNATKIPASTKKAAKDPEKIAKAFKKLMGKSSSEKQKTSSKTKSKSQVSVSKIKENLKSILSPIGKKHLKVSEFEVGSDSYKKEIVNQGIPTSKFNKGEKLIFVSVSSPRREKIIEDDGFNVTAFKSSNTRRQDLKDFVSKTKSLIKDTVKNVYNIYVFRKTFKGKLKAEDVKKLDTTYVIGVIQQTTTESQIVEAVDAYFDKDGMLNALVALAKDNANNHDEAMKGAKHIRDLLFIEAQRRGEEGLTDLTQIKDPELAQYVKLFDSANSLSFNHNSEELLSNSQNFLKELKSAGWDKGTPGGIPVTLKGAHKKVIKFFGDDKNTGFTDTIDTDPNEPITKIIQDGSDSGSIGDAVQKFKIAEDALRQSKFGDEYDRLGKLLENSVKCNDPKTLAKLQEEFDAIEDSMKQDGLDPFKIGNGDMDPQKNILISKWFEAKKRLDNLDTKYYSGLGDGAEAGKDIEKASPPDQEGQVKKKGGWRNGPLGWAIVAAKTTGTILNNSKALTNALSRQVIKNAEDKYVIAQMTVLIENGEKSDSNFQDSRFSVRFDVNDMKWHATNLDDRKMAFDEKKIIDKVLNTESGKKFKAQCLKIWSSIFKSEQNNSPSIISFVIANADKYKIKLDKSVLTKIMKMADNFDKIESAFK